MAYFEIQFSILHIPLCVYDLIHLSWLWYSFGVVMLFPPFLLPGWVCCCISKVDCLRSDWLIQAWSSGVSLSHVSVSSPISILFLINSYTMIWSLFFTDLAFTVASVYCSSCFQCYFVMTVMWTKLSRWRLLIIWTHSGVFFCWFLIYLCMILILVVIFEAFYRDLLCF